MNEPPNELREYEALKLILEGTSRQTGEAFFRSLVRSLASALDVCGAWVTELHADRGELDSFAMWLDGDWVDEYRYAIKGTPCEDVIRGCKPVHVSDRVVQLFPDDPDLEPLHAVSYLGVPLVDSNGQVIGNLAVLDRDPMPLQPRALAIIKIFAARAEAEVARLRSDQALREREEQMRGLIDTALDAIVQLDGQLQVVRANPAARQCFAPSDERLVGEPFPNFLSTDSGAKFGRCVSDLSGARGERSSMWVTGGLQAVRADGTPFQVEASLSHFRAGGDAFVTVILRDVNERLEAEQQIETLRREAEVLREELRSLEGYREILGNAPPLAAMLDDIAQVAGTDTTVLIQGETGTGKELVARAIHANSQRRDRPFVKLNCGAVAAGLIESELFGHEKGAYTGATARRKGRFLLADKGTLFLDEIGELPVDLQVKLLRVLQEGEFEPVGSSMTERVDVRVVAATHRDLEVEVKERRFREDLFYRLNVFPIHVPPLRDRKEDIPVLAEAFTRRFAEKTGRRVTEITAEDLERLKASDWPGNIRELQNVIERAVITSRNERLNLDRALPVSSALPATDPEHGAAVPVRTRRDMEELERANLIQALTQTGWKVSGDDGAAALLEMKPSTLSYRMKALGIQRPA